MSGADRRDRRADSYAWQWRTFTRWCAAESLTALPARPETVVSFLYEHRDRWSAGVVSGVCSAIRYHHLKAGAASPTEAVIVRRFKAASRRYTSGPVERPAPLMDDDIDEIVAAPLEYRQPDGPLFAARDRVALLLSGRWRVHSRQLEKLRRGDVIVDDDWLVIDVAGLPTTRGLPALEAIRVEEPSGSDLHDAVRVLLDELDRHDTLAPDGGFGAAFLNVVARPTRTTGRTSAIAPKLRRRFARAIAQAALAVAPTDPLDLEDQDLAAVLEHVVPGTLRVRRDRAIAVAAQAAGNRPCELRELTVENLAVTTDGFDWTLRCTKPGTDHVVTFGHGGHPAGSDRTCAACTIAAWLEVSGIASGPLFTTIVDGRPTDVALDSARISEAIARAGAAADIRTTGKAARSGRASSTVAAGGSIEDATVANRSSHRGVVAERYVALPPARRARHRLGGGDRA